MDISSRPNEKCIIGLPRCGFSFSSARTCFIGYPFGHGNLEVNILKNILEKRGIIAIEAAAQLTPAQNAFCAKICSQIITSQFCIILLNNELRDGREIPNANVNMEYGLMLGFNKYVIPFQKEAHSLPFNVAGLDTVKYTVEDFERKATEAIDLAIKKTTPETAQQSDLDDLVTSFVFTLDAYLSSIDNDGERNLFDLGRPLGFWLLNNFAGTKVIYLGNFINLRTEQVIWRLRTLDKILRGRIASIPLKVEAGVVPASGAKIAKQILESCPFWAIVVSNEAKALAQKSLAQTPLGHDCTIYSLEDVRIELARLE